MVKYAVLPLCSIPAEIAAERGITTSIRDGHLIRPDVGVANDA